MVYCKITIKYIKVSGCNAKFEKVLLKIHFPNISFFGLLYMYLKSSSSGKCIHPKFRCTDLFSFYYLRIILHSVRIVLFSEHLETFVDI